MKCACRRLEMRVFPQEEVFDREASQKPTVEADQSFRCTCLPR